VAGRDAGVDFAGLAFQGEPELQIDECSLAGPDALRLRGWALVRAGEVRRVEVTLDGELLAAAPVEARRPDVAALFGDRFSHPGWSCLCPLPPAAPRREAVLIVRVVDARGRAQPLWASSIEGALLHSSRQEAAHLQMVTADLQARLALEEARAAADRAGFEARIAAMEASRFWKLRTAWFRVRETLGIREKGMQRR
jgi:hypothetical protein